MVANKNKEPVVVVEGLEIIIKRDLDKHKALLDRTKLELLSYRQAKSHEIKKKRYYLSLIGTGKFNDAALQKAIDTEINTNIQHFSDKTKAAEEKIKHHKRIVDTLSEQLATQETSLKFLEESRKNDGIDD